MPVSWPRLGVGAAIFAIAAAGLAVSPFGAPAIETSLASDARAILLHDGLGFAKARAEGRTLILTGAAPGPASHAAAVKAVAALPGVIKVDKAGLSITERVKAKPVAPEPAPTAPNAMPPKTAVRAAADCQAALNRTLNGRRLTYRLESARLSTEDRALLDDVAEAARSCANQTIVIEGHTDATGSEAANLRLSERRANAVEAYLRQFELPAALVVRAYGEMRPIASNNSEAGRSANRRIDFVVAAPSAEPPAGSD